MLPLVVFLAATLVIVVDVGDASACGGGSSGGGDDDDDNDELLLLILSLVIVGDVVDVVLLGDKDAVGAVALAGDEFGVVLPVVGVIGVCCADVCGSELGCCCCDELDTVVACAF